MASSLVVRWTIKNGEYSVSVPPPVSGSWQVPLPLYRARVTSKPLEYKSFTMSPDCRARAGRQTSRHSMRQYRETVRYEVCHISSSSLVVKLDADCSAHPRPFSPHIGIDNQLRSGIESLSRSDGLKCSSHLLHSPTRVQSAPRCDWRSEFSCVSDAQSVSCRRPDVLHLLSGGDG